jgi:hypothetical protein
MPQYLKDWRDDYEPDEDENGIFRLRRKRSAKTLDVLQPGQSVRTPWYLVDSAPPPYPTRSAMDPLAPPNGHAQ